MRRLRPWALVLGGLLCAAAAAAAGPPPRSYPHSAVLDGAAAYRLLWGRRGSSLAFRLEVRTRGYVGFGLSASGGMASADIVVGGVERGQPYLQVRPGAAGTPLLPRVPGPLCPPTFPPCRLFLGTPLFPCPSFVCSLFAPHLRTSLLLPHSFLVIPIVVRPSPPQRSYSFSYSFSVRSLPTFPLNFYVGFVKGVRFPSSLSRKCNSPFLSLWALSPCRTSLPGPEEERGGMAEPLPPRCGTFSLTQP